jgi:hypothetical protein
MLDLLSKILSTTELLGLLVIGGGTLILGALVAPILFVNLSRQEAGASMMEIFLNFEYWLKASALAVLVAEVFEILIFGFNFWPSILGLGLVGNSYYIIYLLSPKLRQAYDEHSNGFELLHKKSQLLHKINFALAFMLILVLSS